MVLWWIGNAVLLVVVLPVVIFLLNRVLAALERIRGAAGQILAGGVELVGELQCVPDGLAQTDDDGPRGLRGGGPVRRLRRETSGLGDSQCQQRPG